MLFVELIGLAQFSEVIFWALFDRLILEGAVGSVGDLESKVDALSLAISHSIRDVNNAARAHSGLMKESVAKTFG